MTVTEYELAAVLDHCRSLIDAADQFEHAARARAAKAEAARDGWRGPHRLTFDRRHEDESSDVAGRAQGFRTEADAWAQVWTEAVNKTNQERHDAAVDQISSQRGVGESFIDLFVGDDSREHVRDVRPVPVPTAATRYAATGGLESF